MENAVGALEGAMDANAGDAVYQFEGFMIDVARGLLLDANGTEIQLRHKSFELLRLFVENPGELLDRERINQAIWPDAIVDDNGITQCVRDIRRALHDDEQTIIRTVPRRGYILTSKVAAIADQPGTQAPAVAPPLPDRPSIAVLAFTNMSGDSEQEYFSDGIADDIITELSRIRWLFVIARNSSFAYKGGNTDVKRIGRELGVRYVLEGSVRRGGNRVRVNAQLIDTETGAHVWADRYDRDLSDIFAVQDEITASVAGVIEPALAEAEQQRVLRKPPERLDAWEAYQRGMWHFHKYTAEESQSALAFFRQAIALDPKFAPGHYGHALALQWDTWFFSGRPLSEVQGLPRKEARLAVMLDDRDAMAHAVLAHILMWGSEWDAAIAEARIAFALNPNSAFIISMLGCVLCFGGHNEEALEHLHQAIRASPHDPLRWLWTMWTGAAHWNRRDFAAALEMNREVVRQRPGASQVHFLIASALALLGRLDEARAVFDRAAAQFPNEIPRLSDRWPWLRPVDWETRLSGLRLLVGKVE
jgi:adenylate cyclase